MPFNAKTWRKGKLILAVGLLVMILLRMIWLELRNFEPRSESFPQQASSQVQPRVCSDGDIADWIYRSNFTSLRSRLQALWQCENHEPYIAMQKNLLPVVVFIGSLSVRMVAGGWILPLATAVVILSRGRFIATAGWLGPDLLIAFMLMVVFLFTVLWIRSGHKLAGVLACMACAPLVLVEAALAFIWLALPLSCWLHRFLPIRSVQARYTDPSATLKHLPQSGRGVVAKLRRWRKRLGFDRSLLYCGGMEHQQARLLSPLPLPYSIWVLFHRRWLYVGLWLAAAGLMSSVLVVANLIQPDGLPQALVWQLPALAVPAGLKALAHSIDIDVVICLLLLGIGCLSPRQISLPGYRDISIVSLGFLGSAVVAFWIFPTYSAEHSLGALSRLFLWFDPVLLTLGVMGIVNFVQILFTTIEQKKFIPLASSN